MTDVVDKSTQLHLERVIQESWDNYSRMQTSIPGTISKRKKHKHWFKTHNQKGLKFLRVDHNLNRKRKFSLSRAKCRIFLREPNVPRIGDHVLQCHLEFNTKPWMIFLEARTFDLERQILIPAQWVSIQEEINQECEYLHFSIEIQHLLYCTPLCYLTIPKR